MKNELLRKIQLAELYILKEFHNVCVQHDLSYYIVGGTLLGAVRHGGFIPWDDDLDVAMERKDYEKFVNLVISQPIPGIYLQNYKTDNSFNMYISKLRLDETRLVDERVKNLDMHQGIYIDIFPLDYSENSTGVLLFLRAKLSKMLFHLKAAKLKNAQPTNLMKKIILLPVKLLIVMVPAKLINFFVDKVMVSTDLHATFWVNFCSQYGYRKQTMDKSVYGKPRELVFENGKFFAPVNYEYYLQRIYGNYLALPPEGKRKTIHNFVEIDLGKYGDIRIENGKLLY